LNEIPCLICCFIPKKIVCILLVFLFINSCAALLPNKEVIEVDLNNQELVSEIGRLHIQLNVFLQNYNELLH